MEDSGGRVVPGAASPANTGPTDCLLRILRCQSQKGKTETQEREGVSGPQRPLPQTGAGSRLATQGTQDLAEGVTTQCCFPAGQPGGGQDVGGGPRAEPGRLRVYELETAAESRAARHTQAVSQRNIGEIL